MTNQQEKALAAAILVNSGEFSKTSVMHLLGFNYTSLGKALAEIEDNGYLAEYKQKEADALDFLKSKTLESLNTRDLTTVPAEKLVTMFKGLNEASRLARGQSTSNMAVMMNAINQVANSRLNRNVQISTAQPQSPPPREQSPDNSDIEFSEL
jgi:hypothetical protein